MRYFSNYSVFYLVLFSCLFACDNEVNQLPAMFNLSGFTMGTSYNVKLIHSDNNLDAHSLQSEIENILNDINQQMSTYLESSEISKINQSTSNDWINISHDLYEVINAAQSISHKTNGAFDITIGPIVNLWGFGPDEKRERLPDEETINNLLKSTGFQHLHLQDAPYAIRKDITGIYIDLSGIAKGFAVDKVADYLDQLHINNYMVEIGGEIKASGVNQSHTPWQIGIEKPVYDERVVQEIISLENMAMATSGGYRNFFVYDGKYYSHTINPKTGMPVAHTLASVTVFNETAMFADALATALLVLGPERGIQLAEQEAWPVLFILRDDTGFIEIKTESLIKLQNFKK